MPDNIGISSIQVMLDARKKCDCTENKFAISYGLSF